VGMTNRIAVITGGSRGLGRSMALHLADRGTDVILTYKSAVEKAREVVAQIEAKGRKAVALELDVGDASSFTAFAAALKAELGRVWQRTSFDALVNNAGSAGYASFAETTEAQFDELMRVHLKAPYFLTQRLLPLIADGGSIVNISSGLARFTFPGSSAYAAMKGGVEVLTRYLAKELGPRQINVNTFAPGAIETDFGGGHVRDNKAVNAQIAAVTALGRVGLPDDIGGAVALLLAPENHWITGQRIEASGGTLL
jgi:NAD(P)-dependent dehydrogenase (short-subunit alcohol dehydrogenase family)